jgi:hypothetical protein
MSEHPATVIPAHTLEDIAEVNATGLTPETVAEANAHPEVFANGQRAGGARAVRDLLRTGSWRPAVQAAAANLNPWTEVKVDTENPDRGALMITAGRGSSPG